METPKASADTSTGAGVGKGLLHYGEGLFLLKVFLTIDEQLEHIDIAKAALPLCEEKRCRTK